MAGTNATYLDATAANGTAYYYVVQSANPVGASTNSPESSGAAPDPGISTTVPDAPTDLSVSSVAHQSVNLDWTGSPDVDFYTVYRSTLFDNGGGVSNVLGTIVLANNVTDSPSCTSIPRRRMAASIVIVAIRHECRRRLHQFQYRRRRALALCTGQRTGFLDRHLRANHQYRPSLVRRS